MAEMAGLECGHLYCTECWAEYLSTKVMHEGASQMIECPGNCKIFVNDQMVMSLVKEPRVKLKYQQLITNSFVQCNRLLTWCPAADCSNAVKVQVCISCLKIAPFPGPLLAPQTVEARPVKCLCGHSFCFACRESWHEPVDCELLKKWIKKCDDDRLLFNVVFTASRLQRNGQLDQRPHQGLPQVRRHYREEWRLQPRALQEPELQGLLLLGLPRPVGAARQLLVQVQQVSLV
jgi:hypothetical protein